MCRLALYLGRPLSPASVVFGGTHSLHDQAWRPRELLHGSLNADGWGVAWYPGTEPVRLAATRPIWHEEGLRPLLESVRSGAVVAAVRNATPGIPLDESGVPPLVLERWVFVLNGFVSDFRERYMRSLREGLPDELYGALRGVSDSETLFLLAVAALRRGASMGDALLEVAARVEGQVSERGGEAQLTMALTDGRGAAAVRTSTVDATNSLYLARASGVASGGRILASEPLDDDADWSAVEPHSLVEVTDEGGIRTRSR